MVAAVCAAPTVKPASLSSRAASYRLPDGEKVTDPKAVLTVDALNKGVVIKKGKKVYHKVVL